MKRVVDMILDMTRVQILGIRSDLQAVIHSLHKLGRLHIDDIRDIPDATAQQLTLNQDALNLQEETRHILARLQGLIEILGCSQSEIKNESIGKVSLDEIRLSIKEITPKVKELTERSRDLKAELDILPRYLNTLKKILPIVPASANDPDNATIGILIEESHINTLDIISKRILQMTNGSAKFVAGGVDESTQVLLIVCPREFIPDIEEL